MRRVLQPRFLPQLPRLCQDAGGRCHLGQKLSAATVEKKNVIKNVAYLQSNLGKKSITLKKSNDSLATIEQLKLLNKSAGVKTRVQPTVLEWVQNFSHELNLRGAVGNGSGDGVNASKVLASRISPLEAGHGLDHFQQSKVQETLDFAVSSVKLFRNINQRWFPSLSREVQETLDFAVSSVKLFRNINQRIEAHGFGGVISLLWDESIQLEILHVSNKFLNGRFWSVDVKEWIYFTSIYASPDAAKRKHV
ncbi:hypothetical protein V6N11_024205 [Hibiscus sabdariffa]|uniref:Uncharacterized protein n=1 Tax=Hibiscus sabdariffa TaxID=183260 RepID=A0ABR2N7Z3_9ROSI